MFLLENPLPPNRNKNEQKREKLKRGVYITETDMTQKEVFEDTKVRLTGCFKCLNANAFTNNSLDRKCSVATL